MMTDYRPRPGTKIFDACQAIEREKGLPAGPLGEILGCVANEVKTRLKAPLDARYLVTERRMGVLFFVINEDTGPEEVAQLEDFPRRRHIPAGTLRSVMSMRDQLIASGRLRPAAADGVCIRIDVSAEQALIVLKALAEAT